MSAGAVPDGEQPFTPDGNVEILVDSEGVWFRGLDVVALLEQAGHDDALLQLRQLLTDLGEDL